MSLHDPEQACGIMLDEWLDFVAWSDVLAPIKDRHGSNALVRLSHPVWCLNGVEGCLYWTSGEVSARDPDRGLLQLMIEIAHRLDARVRDSRGWFYLSIEQRYRDPPQGGHEILISCSERSPAANRPKPDAPDESDSEPLSDPIEVLVAGSLICLVAATAILIQS